MQKIHNIIFYPMIFILIIATILLAFGNEKIGFPLMGISVVLIAVEQILMALVVDETKRNEERNDEYKGPSRMEFLESTLGDELIGKQEGYDEAVMGFDYHSMRLIYSVEKVVEILMAQNDWEYDEAREYVDFNIVGARGAIEPIWLECSIEIEL